MDSNLLTDVARLPNTPGILFSLTDNTEHDLFFQFFPPPILNFLYSEREKSYIYLSKQKYFVPRNVSGEDTWNNIIISTRLENQNQTNKFLISFKTQKWIHCDLKKN